MLSSNGSDDTHRRAKRGADSDAYTPEKTQCSLLLVADYRFFRAMGGGCYQETTNYLISLLDRVDKIFTGTEWTDPKRPEERSLTGIVEFGKIRYF